MMTAWGSNCRRLLVVAAGWMTVGMPMIGQRVAAGMKAPEFAAVSIHSTEAVDTIVVDHIEMASEN